MCFLTSTLTWSASVPFSVAVDEEVHAVPPVQAQSGRNTDRGDRDPDVGQPEAPRRRKANLDQALPGEPNFIGAIFL